uniref:Transmembrane protein n=1 Tax=Marseillevirus LCMAC101 TaxID=2506602 RepID=A0A481YTA2_9VIRU|nr:MAG: hypothetical protein LCMAC101_06000 [Marseillevirus LCMAC101]
MGLLAKRMDLDKIVAVILVRVLLITLPSSNVVRIVIIAETQPAVKLAVSVNLEKIAIVLTVIVVVIK